MAENREQIWEAEYPGTSASLCPLREAVIRAEQTLIQSREAFDALNTLLIATEVPMYDWPKPVYNRFRALKRADATDSRHLTVAIRALQQACAQAVKAKPKPESEAAAEPPYIPAKPVGLQTIGIEVRDGQIISTVFPDAAFFLTHGVGGRNSRVIRQFEFKDAVIPEAYAWVLTHDGVTHEPVDQISMTYSPEEFERLCRLEIDTRSEHVLDGGNRLNYRLHPSSPKFLKEIQDYEERKKKWKEAENI